MQKTASKNIIPSESYKFLKIWDATNFNARFVIEYKSYIHLDTMQVRIL